jgi:hypothetical protein
MASFTIIKLSVTRLHLARRAAMFPVTSRVTCVCATPGVYRLYYQSRRVGEAVTIDSDGLYVSHSFTDRGRVVASLREAARWLEVIEDVVAVPVAA